MNASYLAYASLRRFPQILQEPLPQFGREFLVGAPLLVPLRLLPNIFIRRQVELFLHHRVPARVLVHIGGAVSDPLAGDKDGEFYMKLELNHFEGSSVLVAHQVADQAPVLMDLFGPLAIADSALPGRWNHLRPYSRSVGQILCPGPETLYQEADPLADFERVPPRSLSVVWSRPNIQASRVRCKKRQPLALKKRHRLFRFPIRLPAAAAPTILPADPQDPTARYEHVT